MQFLPDPISITEVWLDLIHEYHVLGKENVDTKMVAAMQCHGISHFMTINEKDFKKYRFITVVNPTRPL